MGHPRTQRYPPRALGTLLTDALHAFPLAQVAGKMEDDASSVVGSRVTTGQHMTGAFDTELEGESGLNLEKDLMAADGLGEAMGLLPSMLAGRATKMFTGGNGAPRRSQEPELATSPTPWLIKLAKEAVHELFDLQRDEVQRSWGEVIDREEAVGYLLLDALGIEALPAEARDFGKKAIVTIYHPKKGLKQRDDALKGAAAAKRYKARQAAKKSEAAAAKLAERLAAIDAQRDADRAALWGQELDWQLPEGRLVSAPAPAPPQPIDPAAAAMAAADAELAEAEAAEAAAAEARAAADDKLAAAERAARSSSVALQALGLPGVSSCDELLAWLVAQQEAHLELDGNIPGSKLYLKATKVWEVLDPLDEAIDRAKGERSAAGSNWCDARRARIAAMEHVSQLQIQAAQDEAQRAAAATERLQAQLAQGEAKRAAAEESAREAERQIAKNEARIRELEAGQRVAVHAHAAHVWGAGWHRSPDEPMVINLMGKAASEVAAMAGCVSQAVTGMEERRALNDLNSGLLRVGS